MTDKSNTPERDGALGKIKILSIASIALLVVAILFCGTIIIQTVTQGYVSLFGYSVFRVITPSMEPTLPVDTFIVSQKTDIGEINEGDIVSFVSTESYLKGGVVTHRVVEKKEVNGRVCLITRGDASNSVDAAYVTSDNLVGKMVFRTDPDGFFSRAYAFVTNRQVFFLVVIAPMLLIAGILLKNGIGRIHEQINEIKKEIQNESTDKPDRSEKSDVNTPDDFKQGQDQR